MGGEAQGAGTAQPGEEKGRLTYVCQYLMGRNKDETGRLSSVILSARTRGSWHKLNHKKFHLNTKTPTFFTVMAVIHWHRLPRNVVESPSLKIFKSHLDRALGNLL